MLFSGAHIITQLDEFGQMTEEPHLGYHVHRGCLLGLARSMALG